MSTRYSVLPDHKCLAVDEEVEELVDSDSSAVEGFAVVEG